MRIIRAIFLIAAVLTVLPRGAGASARDFQIWLQALRHEAVQQGISQELVHKALPDNLKLNDRIIQLDRKQPENTITFAQYRKNVLTRDRVNEGRRQMRLHHALLKEINRTYGVEPEYIVALWGIETNFGKNTGGFETIPALVTLAYDGRRSAFFRGELLKALRIVDQGHIGLHQMKGSWAGAMGQCQFMPSSFEKFAQDYNRDGKRDIWNTEADVFASAAAYLLLSGWKAGQPWGYPVILPEGFDNSTIGPKVQKLAEFWRGAGIRGVGGGRVESAPLELISLVQPGGEGEKAYAVFNNYRILLKWNASTYFATTVGLLANSLKND